MSQETSVNFWDKKVNYKRLSTKLYNELVDVYYKQRCKKNPDKFYKVINKLDYEIYQHTRKRIKEKRGPRGFHLDYSGNSEIHKQNIQNILKQIKL